MRSLKLAYSKWCAWERFIRRHDNLLQPWWILLTSQWSTGKKEIEDLIDLLVWTHLFTAPNQSGNSDVNPLWEVCVLLFRLRHGCLKSQWLHIPWLSEWQLFPFQQMLFTIILLWVMSDIPIQQNINHNMKHKLKPLPFLSLKAVTIIKYNFFSDTQS